MSSTDLAERFLTAWKLLEQHLEERWRGGSRGPRPDADTLVRWAADEDVVSRQCAGFLQACRRARNAYAHVAFEGYDGPVTMPPEPVVQRLERVLASLRTPGKASSVARPALTCTSASTVHEVLRLMRKEDLSQLPYWHDDHGWVLVTREQIACWVEVEADRDGQVLVDLESPVQVLADHVEVGPCVPRVLAPGTLLHDVAAALEETLQTPDGQPGGWPTLLVARPGPDAPVRLLTADDLPRIYELLGR